MFKRFKTKRSSFIGVDISSTSVKTLEISRKKNQLFIEAYGCQSLIQREASREQLILSLRSLLINNTASAQTAAVAVPDSTIISKTIQLAANLTEVELEELTLLEAKKNIPYRSNDIYIDFAVLGSAKDALGLVDVLWVASRAENIRKRIEILRAVNLDVKIVAIESQVIAAVANQIVTDFQVNKLPGSLFAIIHLDFAALYFNIFYESNLIYSKEEALDTGAVEVTEARYSETKERMRTDQKPTGYESLSHSLIYLMILHIKTNLKLFFSTNFHDDLDGIFLTGELSLLAGIDVEIEKETGFKTIKYKPSSSFFSNEINSVDFSKIFSFYTLAFGLALRLAREY